MTPTSPLPQHVMDAPQAVPADTTQAAPYDSVWGIDQIPTQGPIGSEAIMLAEDKLFVVLAVVMIIWIGIAYFVYRTDSRLKKNGKLAQGTILISET